MGVDTTRLRGWVFNEIGGALFFAGGVSGRELAALLEVPSVVT